MGMGTKGIFGGLIVGALVGSAVGMILAPKPGKETREAVGSKASDYFNQFRARFGQERAMGKVGATVNHHES